MSAPPPTSPWPAPSLANAVPRLPERAAPTPHDAPNNDAPPSHFIRTPVVAALETARRLINPTLRAEHSALKEDQRIAADLSSLPHGWVVRSATMGDVVHGLAGNADHLVVGPGGVFIIRIEHQPGATIWVSERAMTIDGRHSDALASGRSEAGVVGRRLTDSCGFAVTVQSVLVMVGATVQTVSRPAEVHVRAQHDLRDWLCLQPQRVDADEAVVIGRMITATDSTERGDRHERGSSTTTGICRDVLR
jgi:hypothetical protein